MNGLAIRVSGLAKRYTIGVRRAHYQTLRDAIVEQVGSTFRRRRSASSSASTFWALQGVDLEVKRGEILGLIGSNGAGKTTLLKVLSRITNPTRGYAEIWGKIGSLLEVGTGFHPELTGRENIFLNGAILGMKRAEIERKMASIVEFAEVSQFLDTPVKHYSSGMYLRLAFAVAAHLEPDILLVDEVLAVGDAAFQDKCLGKINDVARQDRTVLFVSHNMSVMAQLCRNIVWLEAGRVKRIGPAKEVIGEYLSSSAGTVSHWRNVTQARSNRPVRVDSARICDLGGDETNVFQYRQVLQVEITYTVLDSVRDLAVLCRVTDQLGNTIWTSWDTDSTSWRGKVRPSGRYTSTCVIEGSLLRPGRYFLTVGARVSSTGFDIHANVLALDVSAVDFPMNIDRLGIVAPLLTWDVARAETMESAREVAAR